MSADKEIWGAFFARVSGAESLGNIAIGYPNVAFTPPANSAPWLELSVFPNTPIEMGLAVTGPVVLQGLLQVLVCSRPGGGIVSGGTIAETVMGLLAKGTTLGPAAVYRKPWISAVVQYDDKSAVPVTVPYRACLYSQ